jgi:hypothetical protein
MKKASDLVKKGIIIESVENLKDENRGKMNYLYEIYKDKVLIKSERTAIWIYNVLQKNQVAT